MNRLTDVSLRALVKQHRNGQVEILDGSVSGLKIRVGAGGTATWTLRLRVTGEGGVSKRGHQKLGRKHRVTLGEYPALSLHAARAAASALLDQAARGINPLLRLEQAAVAIELTLQTVAEKFMKDYVLSKELDSADKYRGALDTHIIPMYGARPAETFTREEARKLMEQAREKRPPPSGRPGGLIGGVEAARTTVGVLRQMYSWAIDENVLKRRDNPASNLQRNLPKKKKGDRVLSLDEARVAYRAAGACGYAFGTHARLMLLTACRLDEWASAKEAWIDLKEALIVIPADEYKSDHVHVVPLVPEAVRILQEEIPKRTTGDYILSSTGGSTPIQSVSKFYRTRFRAAFIALTGAPPVRAFTSHALRRTVATRLAEALGDEGDKLIQRVLGHSDGSATAIYNRYGYVKEMRRALEAWARELTDP